MTARRVLMWLFMFGPIGLGAAMSGAMAASLPPALYQGYSPIPPISGTPPELTHAGTYSKVYSDPINPLDSGAVSITLTGAPDPSVSAGIDSSISTFTASGTLFYYFEILGGSTGAPVTLDLTAALSASSYGDGSGGAAMQIEQVSYISFIYSSAGTACSLEAPCGVLGADWTACSVNEEPGGCGAKSVTVSTKESLYADTIYQVELAASAGAPDPLAPYSVTGGGKGVVDPHLSIDPLTPDAGAYSLAFSAGIGNSPATTVPEPSSWILLGVGFASAGLLGLSRKTCRAREGAV